MEFFVGWCFEVEIQGVVYCLCLHVCLHVLGPGPEMVYPRVVVVQKFDTGWSKKLHMPGNMVRQSCQLPKWKYATAHVCNVGSVLKLQMSGNMA